MIEVVNGMSWLATSNLARSFLAKKLKKTYCGHYVNKSNSIFTAFWKRETSSKRQQDFHKHDWFLPFGTEGQQNISWEQLVPCQRLMKPWSNRMRHFLSMRKRESMLIYVAHDDNHDFLMMMIIMSLHADDDDDDEEIWNKTNGPLIANLRRCSPTTSNNQSTSSWWLEPQLTVCEYFFNSPKSKQNSQTKVWNHNGSSLLNKTISQLC